MKIIYFCLFWITFLYPKITSAQLNGSRTIQFLPVFSESPLQLNTNYEIERTHDRVMITNLKFYISGIELVSKNKVVWSEKNSFHLVDVSNINSLKLNLEITENISFDQLNFNLGIDSITNVSGAMGGDLDPTKGMYWTWQSGYVNFKLEGKSNLCKTRNNEFEFHLGGYQYPNYGMQKIILDVKNSNLIVVNVDVNQMISAVELSMVNQIMEPSKVAVVLANKFSKCFFVK